jgi:virulence-associated protein VapD
LASPKRYKSINFDLDTKRLEKVFGINKRRRGYAAIQYFFATHAFMHRQYSGYISNVKLSYAETYIVIDDLIITCPWLSTCTNRFDVTDYMAQSDAIEYIIAKGTNGEPVIGEEDFSL